MSKRTLILMALCCLMVGMFATTAVAQDMELWVGADELPVSPLACPEGVEAVMPEATEMADSTEMAMMVAHQLMHLTSPDKKSLWLTCRN